jgi:LysR family transcriptional regulator, hydrogen peroxide-inducible genes activator
MPFAPHPFTLRQLQYVVAVAERQSFRKAAEVCHVAQPSLSAQVAQVEEALGVQLFERDTRGVALTAAGRVVIERARALLLASDDLVESARVLSDPFAGTLRIGLIPTIGPYLLPEVAPALRAHYPKLSFVWAEEKTATLIDQLARGELDAAIVALEAEIGDLPRVVLGKDPFVLAAPKSHPLANGKRPLKANELDGERVLFLDEGHCFRDQALAFCSRTGVEEAGYRATSLVTLVQMAAGGAGVTLLPSLALGVENRHQELSVRPFAPQAPFRTVALVWRRGAALEMTLKAVGEALARAYATVEKRTLRAGANGAPR